jgi:glutamate dehydrogenase (NAD(P)+)
MDTYSMHRGYSVPAVVTGKPLSVGGTVGREEATGRGCALVAREAAKAVGLRLEGARVAVQGFGNVGYHAARLLHGMGARVVAVSDSRGGIYRSEGLDPEAVLRYKRETGSVAGFPNARPVTNAELLELPCDILVPAALEGQIHRENAPRIQAQVVVEGANGPTTPEADDILHARGVLVVPDIVANAGGVIVSYFEWVQDLQSFFWEEAEIHQRLERMLVRSLQRVMEVARTHEVDLRTAALIRAIQRVSDALFTLGIYP